MCVKKSKLFRRELEHMTLVMLSTSFAGELNWTNRNSFYPLCSSDRKYACNITQLCSHVPGSTLGLHWSIVRQAGREP